MSDPLSTLYGSEDTYHSPWASADGYSGYVGSNDQSSAFQTASQSAYTGQDEWNTPNDHSGDLPANPPIQHTDASENKLTPQEEAKPVIGWQVTVTGSSVQQGNQKPETILHLEIETCNDTLSIYRSYNDFVTLSHRLNVAHPEAIIPVLPTITQDTRPGAEVEMRLKNKLQIWLCRVNEHAVLGESPYFEEFLRLGNYEPVPLSNQTKNRFGAIRRITSNLGSRAVVSMVDPEGQTIAITEEVDKISDALQQMSKNLQSVDKAQRALGQGYEDLHSHLAEFQTKVLNPDKDHELVRQVYPCYLAFLITIDISTTNDLAGTLSLVADLYKAQSEASLRLITDAINYRGEQIKTVKDRLELKHSALQQHLAARKTADNKLRALERLKSSNNIKPEKVNEAIRDSEDAQEATQLAERRHEHLQQALQSDVWQNFVPQSQTDMNEALLHYVNTNIAGESNALIALKNCQLHIQQYMTAKGVSAD
ncbi:hypothetical protein BZG36_04382 [Bifiguratus adelaidae]|uniref:PX domain-containing protein n=1 Tax=Bifiguratus adelaidae TaxID=1938954 RepID=A0A261XVT1_9FUNG|nr:hypothetical protein BZG36_04382 [Bifiguratus adelaidae]